jgi:hypothetical protein
MKAWPFALIGLTCLAAAGCRTNPAVTALERENRDLEDRIYALEDDLQRGQEDLAKCRRDNQSLRKGGRASTQLESPDQTGRSPQAGGPKLVPPRASRGAAEAEEEESPHIYVQTPKKPLAKDEIPETLKSPIGTPPRPVPGQPKRQGESKAGEAPRFTPGTSPPQGSSPLRDAEPLREPRKLNVPGGASEKDKTGKSRPRPPAAGWAVPVGGTSIVPSADSAQVDRITHHRLLVGGWEFDGRPGDEGIFLLVEPRDAEGRLLAAAAPVSVVLLDRGLAGEAARVARWDLTAEQVATLFRRLDVGEGIYLELPWSAAPPVHGHLHLFVRYTTRDGRRLEASRELDITLANQAAQQDWTPGSGLKTSDEREGGTRRSDFPTSDFRLPTSDSVHSRAASWQSKPLPEEPPEKASGVVAPAGDGSLTSLVREEATPEPAAATVGQVDNLPHSVSATGTGETPVAPNRAVETPAAPNRPVWSPYRR